MVGHLREHLVFAAYSPDIGSHVLFHFQKPINEKSYLHHVTVQSSSLRPFATFHRCCGLGLLPLLMDVFIREELALRVSDILLVDADQTRLVLVEVVHALSMLLGAFAEADGPSVAVFLLAELTREVVFVAHKLIHVVVCQRLRAFFDALLEFRRH